MIQYYIQINRYNKDIVYADSEHGIKTVKNPHLKIVGYINKNCRSWGILPKKHQIGWTLTEEKLENLLTRR